MTYIVFIAGYFAPTIAAAWRLRSAPDRLTGTQTLILTAVVNLIVGWTFFGWVLAWAIVFVKPVRDLALRLARWSPDVSISTPSSNPTIDSPAAPDACSQCGGSGKTTCGACGGRGHWMEGIQAAHCQSCVSSGHVTCTHCNGSGHRPY